MSCPISFWYGFMLRMSSSSPTMNKKDAAAMTMNDSKVCGTKIAYITTVVTKMAIPPSIAVGFLCQRSDFGPATNPYFLARARTIAVRTAEITMLSTPANMAVVVGDADIDS